MIGSDMPGYFDSSVILSVLLNDSNSSEAVEIWNQEDKRVSSILFEAEILNVLRRTQSLQKDVWRKEKEKALVSYLDEISLRNMDMAVIEANREDVRLSQCRTLDSIHLATAILFRKVSPSLKFYTFDKRMKAAAVTLGFE